MFYIYLVCFVYSTCVVELKFNNIGINYQRSLVKFAEMIYKVGGGSRLETLDISFVLTGTR